MYADGDFGLQTYLSYLLVPFYPLFQERGGARIERDQADWEVRRGRSYCYFVLLACLLMFLALVCV
jgi:hypothetical protein